MPTREYLEAALDKAKQLLPDWAWQAIHRAALPSAGGRAAHRAPEEPAILEKLAVAEMRPSVLRSVSDEELLQAHHRLHQLYGGAKRAGRAVEDYVNAHVFVEAEMRRRGMQLDPEDELSAEAEALRKAVPIPEAWDLPDEIMVVPGFASIVGSAVDKGSEAGDLDVLLRAPWIYRDGEDSPYLLLQAHSVTLPLRKVLDPDKTGRIHWVPSPQGPHADAVELYDLVLRRKRVLSRQVIKADDAPDPLYPVGSKVRIASPHGEGHVTGVVREVVYGYAYGVVIEGQEEQGVHRWYVEGDLLPADEFEKAGLRQPLNSPGGKTRIANKLLALVPPHEIYVEPYAGGAALFWKKERSKREVLNDINPDIMAVYQFLRDATDAELEEFSKKDWEGRESLFDRLANENPRSLIDRAYKAWYLSRFGFRGPHSKAGDFRHMDEGEHADASIERLRQLRERLEGVVLENKDALDVIRRYDSPNTFFYIDPPYLGADAGYKHSINQRHLAELGHLLRKIKGKALVSGNAETIKALNLPSSWHTKRILASYSMGRTKPGREQRYELVVANYAITKAAPSMPGLESWLEEAPGRQPHVAKQDALRLKLMGVGAQDSPRFAPAGLLVEYGGTRVMLDGGEGPGGRAVPDGALDSWLVTDLEDELTAGRRRLAERHSIEVAMRDFSKGGLTITAHPVRHTNRKTVGYLIEAGGHRIVWAPEFLEFPSWAAGADIMFAEAAGWDKPVMFAGGAGGHMAALDVANAAREAGVKRLVLAHIGRPTIEAMDRGESLPFGEFGRDGQVFVFGEKAELKPGSRYAVQKPSMAFFTDFRDVDELWDNWAKDVIERRGSILVSPKVDGFRLSVHSTGQIFSEDFKRDYADALPELAKAARGADVDFIVEGELQARREGKYLSRSEIAAFLAKRFDAEPVIYLYDILYSGKDISARPFRERLEELRRVARRLGPAFVVLPQVEVRTRDGLKRAANILLHYGNGLPVEGIVTRDPDMPYSFASTNDYAKTKTYIELKVRVTRVNRTKNGYTYTGALVGEGGELVELGNTFISKEKLADEGDILNVRIEELERKADGTLAWHKPAPLDVDRSRHTPYTVEQAIELARRFGRYSESEFTKQEALPGEEGEESGPRAEAAARYWRENWWKALPSSGRGRWVLHAHWRGLSEEEAKLDFDDLLKTNHSLHYDLRLEGEDGLWGWSIFAGTTTENRPTPRIFRLGGDERMQVAPKLSQPVGWLQVGRPRPLVVEPEGVGATSRKYAKFFALDYGTYQLGVTNRHFVELFLDGQRLKGRYLVQSAEMPDRRFWLLTKPDDQRPYAETHDRNKVIEELRQRGHEVLVWAKPGERPEIIRIRAAKVERFERVIPIWVDKTEEEKRIVYGVVLVPGLVDSQGDIVTAEDIEEAAHRFLVKSRKVGVQHERPARAEVVESYVAPVDMVVAGKRVPKGSWVVAVRVLDDDLWQRVKQGELTGFSIGGTGVRESVEGVMPDGNAA